MCRRLYANTYFREYSIEFGSVEICCGFKLDHFFFFCSFRCSLSHMVLTHKRHFYAYQLHNIVIILRMKATTTFFCCYNCCQWFSFISYTQQRTNNIVWIKLFFSFVLSPCIRSHCVQFLTCRTINGVIIFHAIQFSVIFKNMSFTIAIFSTFAQISSFGILEQRMLLKYYL